VSAASNKSKKGLGRGFDALIPTDLFDESFDPTSVEDHQVSKLIELPVSQINPDPDQPRRHFDENALQDLADSIREFGILQPIVVVKSGTKSYTIVAGERRYRASQIAGLKTIPAIVRTLSDQNKLEISLIENVKRHDLNPIEIATAYLKLREQFNLSLEQISQRVGGKSVSVISNHLRLLKLPDSAKHALANGQLSEGQARTLISADPEIIESILPKIIAESWSAREIEQFMVAIRNKKPSQKSPTAKTTPYETETKRLESLLKSKVQIRTSTRGSGQIVIKFKDKKDFQRQIKLIIKN